MKKTLDILSPAKMGVFKPVPGKDLIVSEEEADPHLSTPAHICLIFIFTVLLLVYSILTLTWHFTRPDEETFAQVPTSTLPPINLKITLRCSNQPLCNDATIVANYSDSSVVSSAAPSAPASDGTGFLTCSGIRSFSVLKNETNTSPTVILPLCYTTDAVVNPQLRTALPVPGLQINFAGINPGVNKATTPHTKDASLAAQAEVTIEADDGSFSRLINMDAWQIKTLLVEQSVSYKDDVLQTMRSNPMAIQYEGGRPNWRSTLLIQQTAFANSYATQRPGSLITVVAGIGGAFYVIVAIVSLLSVLLGVCCPGPLAKKEKEMREAKKAAKKKAEEDNQQEPVSTSPHQGGRTPQEQQQQHWSE